MTGRKSKEFYSQFFQRIVLWVLMFSLVSCGGFSERVLEQGSNHVKLDFDKAVCELTVVDEHVIHVEYYMKNAGRHNESLACVDYELAQVDWKIRETSGDFILSTGMVDMHVGKDNAVVSVLNKNGEVIMAEAASKGKSLIPYTDNGENAWSVTHYLDFDEDEAIYGFGQYQNGIMNWRGQSVDLFQHNMEVALPVLVSSKGYAIFWDNYSQSRFEDGEVGSFWSEVADGLDYYFVYGPDHDKVVSGIRTLTGKAPIMPKWTYGLIQSRARYKTQDEVLETVAEYREREVPLDVIVQDWQYWPGPWGAKEFDADRYPDPKGMMDRLHNEYNTHLLISVWPCLEPGSRDFEEMQAGGFLYPAEERYYYDPFNPDARKLYWKQAKEGLFDYGIDSWWADATEPEINGWETTVDDYKSMMKPSIGSGARYLNAYSLMQSKGMYEGQRSVASYKRVFILTRSAFTGQQRFAAATWSGDVSANWETFRNQVSAGLNFSVTGIPYWSADIGAFFVNDKDWFRTGEFPDGVDDPAYHEFFTRWYQFGAFLPLFRVHGAQTPREIWHFGEPGVPAYDIQIKFDNLRYRLMPYIYSLAGMVTHEDYTIMRPLVMDFPDDPEVYNINNQYMFGPAFLVCPVTAPGVDTWEVYLPECEGGWYDFWTGVHFDGGQVIEAAADYDIMPLFVRAGSIVPMGPFMQFAMEKPADPLEVRYYPGAEGKFSLYEDEGVNYNYEDGKFSWLHFAMEHGEEELSISEPDGTYDGMPVERDINLVIVRENHGVGSDITEADHTYHISLNN